MKPLLAGQSRTFDTWHERLLTAAACGGLEPPPGRATPEDLDDILANSDRIAVQVDPETGKPVLQSRSEGPGDGVRDALVWASNWPRPTELLDPKGHPEHWREVVDLLANSTTTTERTDEVLDRLEPPAGNLWPTRSPRYRAVSRSAAT